MAMLSAMYSPAQLVKVPTNCNVEVAGSGGTTGLGGIVGDGGIVTMPEPSVPGSIFTFIGANPIKWYLSGDLSMEAQISPPTPPVPSAGAVSQVKIMSYNKNLRPAETGTPSTNARSKGRVSILYEQPPCKNVMSFDVYKVWGNPATTTVGTRYAPPIVGPDCWPSSSQLMTFSVDQVSSDNALDAIGFDQYYWEILNRASTPADLVTVSGVTYTSADRSSITIDMNAPNFAGWFNATGPNPYTINVCYGSANPWNGGTTLSQATTGVTCVTKTIGTPLVPAYTGGFPTCVDALSPGLPIAVTSSNYNSAYTYAWTRSNLSWLFTPNGSGGLSITSIGDGNPCTFFLTITGPCGSSSFSYTINRNYTAGLIDPGPVCVSSGSNALTINTAPFAQGNETCWGTIPTGWTWSAVGTSGRTFNIPSSVNASSHIIQLWNCACNSPVTSVTVNVRPPTPGPITGPSCIELGTQVNYSVPTPMFFYTWTLPANWTGTST